MARNETATLGGGCFWCLEAVFDDLVGVLDVVSGYSGGTVPDPTYEQVCAGRTGHAEVVSVTFDPDVLSYRDLLGVFFVIHDPTTRNRQGNDTGPQYRSVVFTHSEAQAETAQAVIRELNLAHVFENRIVTEVTPFTRFFPAEDYHLNYFAKNPTQGYCRMVVAPKVAKFRKEFLDRLKKP